MSLVKLVEDNDQTPQPVREVFDDIKATRKVTWINNFWRALASHPPTLARIWASVKVVMAPGALDPLTKELIYIAVSATNNCDYCLHSHTASARKLGMTDAQFAEMLAVAGLANETNRLANGYKVPVDEVFKPKFD
jgi:AhpD family alkylhydroperoxidase